MGNAGKAWMKSHPENAMTKVASKALRAQAWDKAGQLPGPTMQQNCTAANAAEADAQAAAAANAAAVLQGMTASPVVPSGAQAFSFGEAATWGANGSMFTHTQGRTFPPPPPMARVIPSQRLPDGSYLHIAPWHKPQPQQQQLQQGGLNQDIQLGMMLARMQAAQQEQGRQLEMMQLMSDQGCLYSTHTCTYTNTYTYSFAHSVCQKKEPMLCSCA